jgi:ATP-binding protein involved in chromosome partitioning
VDPRPAVVEDRLAGVKRIVAVSGGKGGTGKSVVASTLALLLAGRGLRTGLLDLDLTGPSDHVILGAPTGFPSEEFGIDPPRVHGVAFLSVTHFVKDHPAPLRGQDSSDVLLELLAITRWGSLDCLVIDMPPGLGDATLDAVRLLRRAEYLAVATSSGVVLETVRKMLRLHAGLGTRVAGLVENMQRQARPEVAALAAEFGVPCLGALPFDESLEAAMGDVGRLRATPFAAALARVADALLGDGGPG